MKSYKGVDIPDAVYADMESKALAEALQTVTCDYVAGDGYEQLPHRTIWEPFENHSMDMLTETIEQFEAQFMEMLLRGYTARLSVADLTREA